MEKKYAFTLPLGKYIYFSYILFLEISQMPKYIYVYGYECVGGCVCVCILGFFSV